ncbi:phage repressor protein [Pantoea ananatis]|uniref:phage repressor protein n=1 Tax=Pantoea ananas TaxID=553 RepID=UPI0010594950|nr:phage repressor protein [Pantoea ananatis]TDL54689.1 phage repressor protein [Pantoea ananatis]
MTFPCKILDCEEVSFDLMDAIPHPNRAMRIDTPMGFALVDSSITPVAGNKVAWQVYGYPMVGKYFRHGIITEVGETIDGESLEDVVMLGIVTHEILSIYEEDWMPF